MVDLALVGFIVIFLGFIVMFLATVFASRSRDGDEKKERPEVRGGGVILIGPVPIIFGSDMKWTVAAIVLAIILIILSLFFTQRLVV